MSNWYQGFACITVQDEDGNAKTVTGITENYKDAVATILNEDIDAGLSSAACSADAIFYGFGFNVESDGEIPELEYSTIQGLPDGVPNAKTLNKYTDESHIAGIYSDNDLTDTDFLSSGTVRPIALHSPAWIAGWGYGTEASGVGEQNDPKSWKAGPLDVKYNDKKKKWEAHPYWFDAKNESGETIPPYSAVRVGWVDEDNIYHVYKPSGESQTPIFLTGNTDIGIGEHLSITYDFPRPVSVDTEVSVGSFIGTDDDSWELKSEKDGYVVVGYDDGKAWVTPSQTSSASGDYANPYDSTYLDKHIEESRDAETEWDRDVQPTGQYGTKTTFLTGVNYSHEGDKILHAFAVDVLFDSYGKTKSISAERRYVVDVAEPLPWTFYEVNARIRIGLIFTATEEANYEIWLKSASWWEDGVGDYSQEIRGYVNKTIASDPTLNNPTFILNGFEDRFNPLPDILALDTSDIPGAHWEQYLSVGGYIQFTLHDFNLGDNQTELFVGIRII